MNNIIILFSLITSFNFAYSCKKYTKKDAYKDLKFIKNMIEENHPGFLINDKLFSTCEYKIFFNEAKNLIKKSNNEIQRKYIIYKFLKLFKDNHLGVCFKHISFEINNYKDNEKLFSLKQINSDTCLIKIPSFAYNSLTKMEKKLFDKLIQSIQININKKCKTIIFDLRGNTGGNPNLGTSILKLIFGTNFVSNKIYNLEKNIKILYRITKKNVNYWISSYKDYLENCNKEYFKNHKEEEINIKNDFKKFCAECKENLRKNKFFKIINLNENHQIDYSSSPAITPKIIIIIDKNVFSAALQFIDYTLSLGLETILIGQPTNSDTFYLDTMNNILLPSKEGFLYMPTKAFIGRKRKNNESYYPKIYLEDDVLYNDEKLIHKITDELI
jgi:hypothetical protein